MALPNPQLLHVHNAVVDPVALAREELAREELQGLGKYSVVPPAAPAATAAESLTAVPTSNAPRQQAPQRLSASTPPAASLTPQISTKSDDVFGNINNKSWGELADEETPIASTDTSWRSPPPPSATPRERQQKEKAQPKKGTPPPPIVPVKQSPQRGGGHAEPASREQQPPLSALAPQTPSSAKNHRDAGFAAKLESSPSNLRVAPRPQLGHAALAASSPSSAAASSPQRSERHSDRRDDDAPVEISSRGSTDMRSPKHRSSAEEPSHKALSQPRSGGSAQKSAAAVAAEVDVSLVSSGAGTGSGRKSNGNGTGGRRSSGADNNGVATGGGGRDGNPERSGGGRNRGGGSGEGGRSKITAADWDVSKLGPLIIKRDL